MTLFQCGGGGHHLPNLARVPDVNLIRVKTICTDLWPFKGASVHTWFTRDIKLSYTLNKMTTEIVWWKIRDPKFHWKEMYWIEILLDWKTWLKFKWILERKLWLPNLDQMSMLFSFKLCHEEFVQLRPKIRAENLWAENLLEIIDY